MKKYPKLTAMVYILLVLTVAFIWGNSMQSIPESQAKSLGVLDCIRPFLEVFVGKGNVTDHLVRKLAHFTEYGTLGCELILLLALRRRVRLQPVINCAFAALAVAVTDETIQIFSKRGSQVSDAVLDFSGAATGMVVALLIFWLAVTVRKKRRLSAKH